MQIGIFKFTSDISHQVTEIFKCHPCMLLLCILAIRYSETYQVDRLHKVTTYRCWPHIGRTGEVLYSLHIRPPP